MYIVLGILAIKMLADLYISLCYCNVHPQGYLKISIIVIAPGDEPKHSPSYMSPENVDIES